jgi:hypothetical protein
MSYELEALAPLPVRAVEVDVLLAIAAAEVTARKVETHDQRVGLGNLT